MINRTIPPILQPTLLYSNPKSRILYYLAAGGQFVFWISMTEICYNHLKDTQDNEKLESYSTRLRYAGCCLLAAIGTPLLVQFYGSRKITNMTLLKGGYLLRLETLSLFKNSRYKVYPVSKLKSNHPFSVDNKSKDIAIQYDQKYTYLLDNRGSFYHSNIFNELFYNKM